MTSAWGKSWGSAWNGAWGSIAQNLVSSGGYYEPITRRKTKEDVHAERILYGMLKQPEAVQAIEQVAEAVIEADAKTGLTLSEQEQSALLKNLLAEKGLIIESFFDIKHLLNEVIELEVRRLIELRLMAERFEEEQIVMLMFNEL